MRLVNLLSFYIIIIIFVSHVFAEHKRIKRLMYAMCPPNFIGIGSLCYYISNYPTSWLEAQFECKDKNSKLAEPIKLADKKLRRYLLEHDKNHSDIWIGGTFNRQTKKWTWGYSGKDVAYNSFSQLDLGSSKDVHYHCVVLDPKLKYKWSARSCVDQHRFVCQHKMPKVSDKNRMKIYTRWNETYPNQLANEVVIELSGDDVQRTSRVIRGHNSSTYYYVDCKIRRFDSSYSQRRRRMPPHSAGSTITPSVIVSPHSKKTAKTIDNANIEFEAHEVNSRPVVHIGYHHNFTANKNELKNNENHFNYKIQPDDNRKHENTINGTSSEPEQRTTFDLEIEKKRLKARKRRLERKKARQMQKDFRKLNTERKAEQKKLQEELEDKRKANLMELEALRKQTEEQENERRQSEIDRNRIQEITQQQQQARELEEKERRQKEIEHQRITEERKRNQKEHEQRLIEKGRQHEEWRTKLKANDDEQEMRDEEDRQKLIKQQEEEYKKFQKEREAEEKKRLDEELARLEKERKLREQRQKERDEEIKRRQELIKKQEEEERLLQEDIKRREEEIRKAREEEKRRKEEEQRKKELEELRKKIEKEEKLRQKQLKLQRAQEEKKREIRERLSKLSPEEQILFFKQRQERKKRKRLAHQYENEVSIPK